MDGTTGPSARARRKTLRTAAEFVTTGLADGGRAPDIARAITAFNAAVPPGLADRIDARDPDDPIARQFVPDPAELAIDAADLADPIGDASHSPVRGIVHRYPDRVLLLPQMACPAYCRYCFRRATVGPDGGALDERALETALAYIEAHAGLSEVILSGGEPLMLSDRRLARILGRLARMPHLGWLRIHTRMPIVDPARITRGLIAALGADIPVYVVIHCNHAGELSPEVCAAIRLLADAGIPLLAQTVLLKGVNDDDDTLATLMRLLVRNRVRPYYLHHPDLARGTAHFRVSIEHGQRLVRALRGRLSGLCQPTYVLDIPGGHGKVPIGPCYLEPADAQGARIVTDPWGDAHAYPPPTADRPGYPR